MNYVLVICFCDFYFLLLRISKHPIYFCELIYKSYIRKTFKGYGNKR